MKLAFVSEIYPSVQGEGPYTGERQIFLRMAGCPLRCTYCDTPGSLTPEGHQRLSVDDVVKEISRVQRETRIGTVSATGGEPLVYAPFLSEVFEALKKSNTRIYLETAGIHPESLAAVVDLCDVIAMDMKLPSATGQSYWSEHDRFLQVGAGKIFVKVVLDSKSKLDEVEKVISILKERSTPPLLVLQPATPIEPVTQAPTSDFVALSFALAKAALPTVLVMPQQHKIWGVR